MHVYATIIRDRDRIAYVDSWLEVTDFVGDASKVAQVRQKFAPDPDYQKRMESAARALNGMQLRARVNNAHFVTVKSEVEMTPVVLEVYLRQLTNEEYRQFIADRS